MVEATNVKMEEEEEKKLKLNDWNNIIRCRGSRTLKSGQT